MPPSGNLGPRPALRPVPDRRLRVSRAARDCLRSIGFRVLPDGLTAAKVRAAKSAGGEIPDAGESVQD
jgi:hypothetical protein